METEQTPLDTLIDRYIAMWNEPDTARRRTLIARIWTDDAQYVDPAAQGAGHAGIDAMVQGVQARFPGYRFRRTGPLDSYGDRVRFGWELAPAAGAAIVQGTDFGIVAADGRLSMITGFFDSVAIPADAT